MHLYVENVYTGGGLNMGGDWLITCAFIYVNRVTFYMDGNRWRLEKNKTNRRVMRGHRSVPRYSEPLTGWACYSEPQAHYNEMEFCLGPGVLTKTTS